MTYDAAGSVATAKAWIGYHEGRNNYNVFSIWQGLNAYNPWCASFTCYCAVEGGGYIFPSSDTFGYKGEAYVPTMRERAINEGLWRNKWWTANPGDFVTFDWEHDGVLDHVGVVVVDDGYKIIYVGGNESNAVLYRMVDRTYVGGFVALSESIQAIPVLPPPNIPPAPTFKQEPDMYIQTWDYLTGKEIPTKNPAGDYQVARIIPAQDGNCVECHSGANLQGASDPKQAIKRLIPSRLGSAKVVSVTKWDPRDNTIPGVYVLFSDGRGQPIRHAHNA